MAVIMSNATVVLNYVTTNGDPIGPGPQADFQAVVTQLLALGYTIEQQIQLTNGVTYILGKEYRH